MRNYILTYIGKNYSNNHSP